MPNICVSCGGPHDGTRKKTRYLVGDRKYTVQESRCLRCLALKHRKYRNTPRGQFTQAKSIAVRRGILWELSQEEYTVLRAQPCHYCGFSLPPSGMGIDRREFKLGYTLGNVVPCCTECNLAKNASFTYDEMRQLGIVIASIKTERLVRGEANHKFGRPLKHHD